MSVVLYDGSFEGFLTLLAVLSREKRPLKALRVKNARLHSGERELFEEYLPTQPELARAFYEQLQRTIPFELWEKLPLFYLCDQEEVEIPLALLLRDAARKPHLFEDLTYEPAFHLYRAEGWFRRERHRWLGLLRFVQLPKGLLFARFEPSLNVLPHLYPHFVRRFPQENFLIFDSRRKFLFTFFQKQKSLLWVEDLKADVFPGIDPFIPLWQAYFEEIAVPERQNPKRQQGKLPLRVRPFLPEFWSTKSLFP